jgi:hypothetical protein
MKMIRDVKLFENDSIKIIKLGMINENEEEINY